MSELSTFQKQWISTSHAQSAQSDVVQPAVRRQPEVTPATTLEPCFAPVDEDEDEDEDVAPFSWLQFWSSSAFSLLFHLVLMLILAAIWFSNKEADVPLGIISSVGEKPGETEFEMTSEMPLLVSTPELAESKEDLTLEAVLNEPADLLVTSGLDFASLRSGDMAAGGTQGGKIGFFGNQIEGSSFVFILDSSGSMNGPRFARAIQEMKNTIEQLSSKQKFYVFFYNDIAIPMRKGRIRLYTASNKTKQRTINWVVRQYAGGGTMPESAVRLSLRMKPEIIFFMTDGEVPRNVRTIFQEENKSHTVVHTIAFQSKEGEVIMQGIAADNKGRYRYVE